jgi:hypothetical protein
VTPIDNAVIVCLPLSADAVWAAKAGLTPETPTMSRDAARMLAVLFIFHSST